jgi:hypothetical protein
MQSATDTKTSKTFNPPRLAIATVAVVATVAALGVGPAAASPAIGGAGCPTWMCGTSGNHNEVMATTAAA